MTPAEELLVKIRVALDAEKTAAINAVAGGVRDWSDYRYEVGRIDALSRAYAIVNEEADKLGRDDE